MYFDARREGGRLTLALRDAWRCAGLASIDAALTELPLAGANQLDIDVADAELDLSGAWLLHNLARRAQSQGATVSYAGGTPPLVALVERTLAGESAQAASETSASAAEWLDPAAAVESIGRRAVRSVAGAQATLAYTGRVSATAARAAVHWRALHPTSIARHIYDTGITAIPIVSLIAFLISVILAYIGAQQLLKFGADIFVVDLVTIGVLRELGVLLTAIIVAGRSGSAYAAEIGAMKLNEEIDALHATGVDPIEVLVLPRFLGLVVALPLLTVIADIVGLVGGGLLCHWLLDMPISQYLNRADESIASTTFWVGIIKAPVFAALISMAGTWCGMRVRGSSRELGRLTTLAVVQAIFFVILADALFAVLFMELDI